MLLYYINSILDYGQIMKDKLILKLEKFDLNSAVNEIFEIFKNEFDSKKIEISTSYENVKDFNIFNDKQRLQTVLIILLGNALKYTNKGFVKLFIS